MIEYNGQAVTYDLDGNMLSANGMLLTYDSANRLISAGNNNYTYDVENTRVKNLCGGVETEYTYNTNSELSQLLVKTTGNSITKYVYGIGLIGEETNNTFKTYHFDYRGNTVAITDINGAVTDRFAYDSYGNLTSRTGTSETIFLYNGEYGVVTDTNGLLYMRARYYSPELRRFVNADILMGDINNSPTLNRYAYANGNPISNIDPFGLAADKSRGGLGTLIYNDVSYDIFYPNMSENTYFEAIWNLENEITFEMARWDWLKFLATLGLEDYENKNYAFNSLAGLSGIISSANNSIEKTYLTIKLYNRDSDERKASIAISTADASKKYQDAANIFGGQLISSSNLSDKLGKEVENGLYWMYASISEAHLKNDATGYLWYDGTSLMNKPYILPSDNIFAKKLSIFSDSVIYKLPLSKESFSVDEILSQVIMKKLNSNNIYIK